MEIKIQKNGIVEIPPVETQPFSIKPCRPVIPEEDPPTKKESAAAVRIKKDLVKCAEAAKSELDIRDKAKAKVAHIQNTIADLLQKAKKLQARKVELKEHLNGVFAKGESPEKIFRDSREVDTEIQNTQAWVEELKEKSLPQAQEELEAAQRAVDRVLRVEVHEVAQMHQDRLAEMADAIHDELSGWIIAEAEWAGELGCPLYITVISVKVSQLFAQSYSTK
jgi:hypothetical protein